MIASEAAPPRFTAVAINNSIWAEILDVTAVDKETDIVQVTVNSGKTQSRHFKSRSRFSMATIFFSRRKAIDTRNGLPGTRSPLFWSFLSIINQGKSNLRMGQAQAVENIHDMGWLCPAGSLNTWDEQVY